MSHHPLALLLVLLLLASAACTAAPEQPSDPTAAEASDSTPSDQSDADESAPQQSDAQPSDAEQSGAEPSGAGESAPGADGAQRWAVQEAAADPSAVPDAPQPSADDVLLPAGEDWATIIADGQPGTTYRIPAGLHRGQRIEPNDGDTILGDDGAIVSGTIGLDPAAFQAVDGVWVMAGRQEEPWLTEDGQLHGEMEEGFARDAANHDLWWDDERWQHVEARGDVDQAGEWFFDYDADEVVVGADPAGSSALELAVTERFLDASADGVTVANLVIERFASPAQRGAITITGEDWALMDLEVRESHGTGIIAWHGTTVDRVIIRDQGQMGIATTRGERIAVRDSEIVGNGHLRYIWSWERGGLKFKESVDSIVVRTHAHRNDGPAIWFDLFNRGALIADNLAEDNEVNGIFYEISDAAIIRDNEVRDNGRDAGALGTGIFVSICTDVLVEGNTTSGHNGEIVIVHADRTHEFGSGVDTEDVVVRGNTVTIAEEGGVGFYADTGEDEYYVKKGITFEDNDYTIDGCERCFRWGETITAEEWLEVGHDADGTIEDGA